MNTEHRKKDKYDFEKCSFKLINNEVFGKSRENVRKHRNMKLVTAEARGIYLVSEPNYNTIKKFSENVLPIKMKKKKH